ncbi:hypothetical protein PF005_g2678 [Phytophthora fragariae]|uniref:Secreted protein n=1 Tax=Phytophthora fragariae TaxID=53985 RepID=A0A6A3F6Q3_9STRA|nr:hypothetical protein PF003_g4766 [Phytophthora fragariae]KAE8939410.1 hypothetical protein PF009_g10739 [Phytophthora fragariae]KAE9013817.1 hypothetical protein PF011_g8312 [Phytophthora fragariae]KAE9116792.1 hypothetical protein PF010_g8822 [Phytophthora fragariae]KAE9117341.1 hypothetical protein PF007_g9310 [Phytophthora fragariae]
MPCVCRLWSLPLVLILGQVLLLGRNSKSVLFLGKAQCKVAFVVALNPTTTSVFQSAPAPACSQACKDSPNLRNMGVYRTRLAKLSQGYGALSVG